MIMSNELFVILGAAGRLWVAVYVQTLDLAAATEPTRLAEACTDTPSKLLRTARVQRTTYSICQYVITVKHTVCVDINMNTYIYICI